MQRWNLLNITKQLLVVVVVEAQVMVDLCRTLDRGLDIIEDRLLILVFLMGLNILIFLLAQELLKLQNLLIRLYLLHLYLLVRLPLHQVLHLVLLLVQPDHQYVEEKNTASEDIMMMNGQMTMKIRKSNLHFMIIIIHLNTYFIR